MQQTITIGADPELFAFNKENKPVSVHDLLPGTKWNPCKVPKGAIQVDGVAAEFNIDPAATRKVFLRNIKHVQRILNKFTAKNGLVLRAVPTVHFNEKYFADLPTETKALGCEPDYNAYTQAANDKPETNKPMRTGSGHVHIGWSDCDNESPDYVYLVCEMVKELDFVLYQQSSKWDTDTERMELYGKPGAFRFKKYGLEYRVLSNNWLKHDGITAFVFEAAYAVARNVLNGVKYYDKFEGSDLTHDDKLRCANYPLLEDLYAKAA